MDFSKIRESIKQIKIQNLVVLYIIVYTVSPWVNQATSRMLTTYFYMGVVVITVVYTFVTCGLKDIKEYVFLLLPFVLFEILEMFIADKSNMLILGYRVLLFMLPICLGYTIVKTSMHIKLYARCVVIVFFVTSATTIIGCINNPNAARILATTATSQDTTAVAFNWQNIGGFSFVYACTLLYPLAVLAYKRGRLRLIWAVLTAVGIFALAVNTEYTLSLMLVLLTSVFFFLPKDMSFKKLVLIAALGVVLIIVFSSVVVAVLNYISGLIGNDSMGEKMVVIFGGQEAIENLDDKRIDRYWTSIESFLHNPLFGTFLTGGKYGGHSFVFDTLAHYGLLGSTLLFFMYRSVYKIFYQPLKDEMGSGFLMWLFLVPIILSCLNTGMWLDNLCLFSPLFLCLVFSPDAFRQTAKSKLLASSRLRFTAPVKEE